MMLGLHFKPRPSLHSLSFSPPKRHHLKKPYSLFSSSSPRMSSSSSIIEHIVLFKVKPDADPTKVNAMVSNLNGLVSLDQVLHLNAGPVLRSRSSLFQFTHMLHSRYRSKDDLGAYSAHPTHMGVVKENVLPICEDIMAVDWVSKQLTASAAKIPPGSALKVSFLKLKDGLGENEKNEVLGVVGGIKDKFVDLKELSSGENFSPARAKGFLIASLAVFDGEKGLEAVEKNGDLIDEEKGKVREYLDGAIVVDYVVPSGFQSTSL